MLFAGLLLAIGPAVRTAQEALAERTNRAIEAGVAHLLEAQGPDGSWGRGQRAGLTALALYALLKSGVEPTDVAVLDAVAEVYDMDPPHQTYDTAIAILALAAHDPEAHAERIAQLARALIDWQDGGWGYPQGNDLSNTQYAALGLWAARRAGAEVGERVWLELLEALADYRVNNGGFGYSHGGNPSGSMTAAGLGTLAICREALRDSGALREEDTERIARWLEEGLTWLAKRFSVASNPEGGAWHHYYLYGLERVGALADVTHIGAHDWYLEGAEQILGEQGPDGGWHEGSDYLEVASTCFALLFLRRATQPMTAVPAGRGGAGGQKSGTLDTHAAVQLVATGGDPLTLSIEGFGPEALVELEWPDDRGRGLRILRVAYFDGDEPIATLGGDTGEPARLPRFTIRRRVASGCEHRVRAEVHVLAPPDASGVSHARVLRSPEIVLSSADVAPAWRMELARDLARNLVPVARPAARASSSWTEERVDARLDHGAERAVDGRLGTCWLADPTDRRPRLDITFSEPPTASAILVTNAISRPYRVGAYARALEIEITVDGAVHRLRMPYDELHKGRLELPGPTRIRELSLQIVWSVPGESEPAVGLAEVELQAE